MAKKELIMTLNMGPWDRLIRLILAAAVAMLLLTKVLLGTLALVLGLLALVLGLTALTGFCPIYALFGLSTRGKAPESR
jgi:hypothetical protein